MEQFHNSSCNWTCCWFFWCPKVQDSQCLLEGIIVRQSISARTSLQLMEKWSGFCKFVGKGLLTRSRKILKRVLNWHISERTAKNVDKSWKSRCPPVTEEIPSSFSWGPSFERNKAFISLCDHSWLSHCYSCLIKSKESWSSFDNFFNFFYQETAMVRHHSTCENYQL